MVRGAPQGQDRRLAADPVTPCPTHAPTRARLLLVVGGASALCVGVAGLVDVAGIQVPSTIGHFPETLRVVASAMFVGAGVMRLSRGRISDDPRNALMGVALIALGGTAIPFAGVAALVAGGAPGAIHEPVTRAVATAVILALVLRAVISGPRTPQPPTIWLLIGTLASTGGGFLGVLTLNRWAADTLYAGLAVRAGLELAMSLAWLGVGVVAWRHHERFAWAGRVAPLLGAMSLVAVLRAVAVYRTDAFALASAALAAFVSCVVAYCALIDLVDTTVTEHAYLRRVVHGQQSWREEFSHDARNSLAGLRATLSTLERYAGRLSDETLTSLRSAAIGELGHLDHLIVGSERATPVDFRIDEVVRSVVETRRATGLTVHLVVGEDLAHGIPGDVATTLQNLLVNAQAHAPGHAVTLRSEPSTDTLRLHVTDRGPGICDPVADRLFERGARGEQSHGAGLGLYLSRELMRSQGGDLRLVSHTDGCEFEISIPLAPPQAAHIPRQRPADAPVAVEAT